MIPEDEGGKGSLSALVKSKDSLGHRNLCLSVRFVHQGAAPSNVKSKDVATTAIDRESQSKRYRYGAWYLPKELWQRALVTEELRDPKVIKAEREDATRKRQEEIVRDYSH